MAKKAKRGLKGWRKRERAAAARVARSRPRASTQGTITIGDVSFAATNIDVRDRDGDIFDAGGVSIPALLDGIQVQTGQWQPRDWRQVAVDSAVRSLTAGVLTPNELRPVNASDWFNTVVRSEVDFAGIGRDLAITGNAFVHKPPPEPAELLALVAALQSIPPLEFVPWRERAAIVADWLEERGDERGTRLRQAVTGKQDWDGFIGQLARHHSVFAEFMTVIIHGGTSNGSPWRGIAGNRWREVVAWVLEEFRWDIMNRAGLGYCARHPHGVQEDGGYPIPPWIARLVKADDIGAVSIGFEPLPVGDYPEANFEQVFRDRIIESLGIPPVIVGDSIVHGDPTAPMPQGVINAPVETDRQRRRREAAGLPATLLGRPVVVTEGEDR